MCCPGGSCSTVSYVGAGGGDCHDWHRVLAVQDLKVCWGVGVWGRTVTLDFQGMACAGFEVVGVW
jgi:hypothetical protein